MKRLSPFAQTIAALLAVLGASGSQALSIGQLRGAATIGLPLDVRVPVVAEGLGESDFRCFSADVFHGDTRVDPSRVRVGMEGQAPNFVVRVWSALPVDEPVVRMVLRADCAEKSSRSFTLLSDLPVSSPAAPGGGVIQMPAVPQAIVVEAQTAVPAPAVSATVPLAQPVVGRPQAERNRQAQAPRRVTAGPVAENRPARPNRPPVAATGKAEARLKIDLTDVLAERSPHLKSSGELLSQPSSDPAQRAQALALWQAINAQAQEVLRDAQRVQTLEAEMKALRQAQARMQSDMLQLQGQLEQARTERYANELVYGLAAALGAVLLAVALTWRRVRVRRPAPAWWSMATAHDDDDEPVPAVSKGKPVAAEAVPPAPVPTVATVSAPVPPPAPAPASAPSALAAAPAAPGVAADFVDASLVIPAGRMDRRDAVRAEEIFDLEQQADFFESVGQHDQAIEVLKNHIAENAPASPTVYLHLLGIYHAYSRREDFNRLREVFCETFNSRIPPFAEFRDEGRGLEEYPAVLAEIQGFWGRAGMLDAIEEYLYRDQGRSQQAFDLAAYRDLLLLHGVAMSLPPPGPDVSDPPSFPAVDLPAAAETQQPAESAVPRSNLIEFDLQALKAEPSVH